MPYILNPFTGTFDYYKTSGGAGSGDVVGPASATTNNVVFFDGATGKLIKDSGLTLSGSNTGDQDLSTLVPKTTTVNGHALSANVTVTATDVGLGNVNNTSDATKNAAVATLTNKTITKRIVSVSVPGATPATNTDNMDIAEFTALGVDITSMTTNLTGTPVDGQLLQFAFVDDGTARAITWGTSFANSTVSLPTTTVISTVLRVLVQYQTIATLNKWVCVAVA